MPESLAGQGWSEGMDMDVFGELLAYWSSAFDWHAQNAADSHPWLAGFVHLFGPGVDRVEDVPGP
ncbi:epoxide hydrolase N-terminal domain-containing protein [Pseudomonas sp. 39167]|nr:epoxide hydrolase N-terminal domain-containing protein [Pseudomonas sp. 39167]MDD2034036.1 epoxide hydrolase N-terminal domain-containing protein [Pseudomonas sp. 39167]